MAREFRLTCGFWVAFEMKMTLGRHIAVRNARSMPMFSLSHVYANLETLVFMKRLNYACCSVDFDNY